MESPEVKAYLKTNMPRASEWARSDQETLELDIAFLKYQAYMALLEKLLLEHPEACIEATFDHEEIMKRAKMTLRKCRQ